MPDNIARRIISLDNEDTRREEDYKNRRLFLYGTINGYDSDEHGLGYASQVGGIIERILEYNRQDNDESKEPSKRDPIRLYINSLGGDVVEAFSLIDTIMLSKTPVWTINMGGCFSSAALILMAGKRRFMMPNGVFMIHDGYTGCFDSFSKVQDRNDFEKLFEEEKVKIHVLECSDGLLTEAEYEHNKRKDWYLLAEKALEKGFIDEIITDINAIL